MAVAVIVASETHATVDAILNGFVVVKVVVKVCVNVGVKVVVKVVVKVFGLGDFVFL